MKIENAKKKLNESFSKICAVTLIAFLFAATAFSQQATAEWKIDDYLKNLPEKYKTYSGDFQMTPTGETTIADTKNGYAAYLSSTAEDAFPIFEMAIFKQANGEAVVVVSNTIADPVCTTHETFFLRRKGNVWTSVQSQILPELQTQMFFTDSKLGTKFQAVNRKAGNSNRLNLHFSPPRNGIKMKVSLDICDYVPDELAAELSFDEFIRNAKSVVLEWDKQTGVFKRTR